MKNQWSKQDGAGRLVLKQKPEIILRLFGFPFLLIGFYFVYYETLSLLQLLRFWSLKDFWQDLPMLLLLAVMALAFGIPGVICVLVSVKTIIDGGLQEIIDEKNFFLFKRQKRYPARDFSAVKIAYVSQDTGSSNRSSGFWVSGFDIQLTRKVGQPFLLMQMKETERDKAKELANEISNRLVLSLQDNSAEADLPENQTAESPKKLYEAKVKRWLEEHGIRGFLGKILALLYRGLRGIVDLIFTSF